MRKIQKRRASSSGLRVLEAVLWHGDRGMSHSDLAKAAGTSRRTMTNVAKELVPARVLERGAATFGPGAGLVLAFAIGTENIRCALVDANGLLHALVQALPDRKQLSEPPNYILGRLREVALVVLEHGLAEPELCDRDGRLQLLGATIAWPGPIARDGYARASIFEDVQWQTLPLIQRLGASLGPPFSANRVDSINGANAAVSALAFDRSKDDASSRPPHSEILMAVRLGGVLAAGTMRVPQSCQDGQFPYLAAQLIVGTNGQAGELAHLPATGAAIEAINAQRPARLAELTRGTCSCGNEGHLEGLVGARALARRLEGSGYVIDLFRALGPQLEPILRDRDEVTRRALQDIGRLLGQALWSPILMLDPASITLTGYLARPDVVVGINGELSLLPAPSASSVSLDVLSGDENDYVEVRGAALLRFRRAIYRQMTALIDPATRAACLVPFGQAELRAMADFARD